MPKDSWQRIEKNFSEKMKKNYGNPGKFQLFSEKNYDEI